MVDSSKALTLRQAQDIAPDPSPLRQAQGIAHRRVRLGEGRKGKILGKHWR